MPRATTTLLLLTAVLAGTPGTALAKGLLPEPDQGPDPRGLTVSASDVARVNKPAKLSEETIAAAIEAARPKALARAVAQARARASALTKAAGLTLGDLQAIRDRNPAGGDEGVFFPRTYCRPRRPSGPPRCSVPLFAVAAISVTFATSETSAAVGAGRAVIATAADTAPVKPDKRRSSASIREAITHSRLAAIPGAFAAARKRAAQVGRAGGMVIGTPFAIAEVTHQFDEIAFGRFGPGRYCGTFRRTTARRDPATGRPRLIRHRPQRVCSFPNQTSVAMRVTYLPR